MRTNLFRWLAVVLWVLLIFWLSDQPSLASTFPPSWDFVLRKMAHATEFGVLALFLHRALEMNGKQKAIVALLLAGFVALLDEYHQTQVAGRFGVGTDVLIDCFGAAVGALWPLTRKYTSSH